MLIVSYAEESSSVSAGSSVCADYNPLTGGGGSGNYRPERRGGAMGGGGG